MTEHSENDLIRRSDAMRAVLHNEGDALREIVRTIPKVLAVEKRELARRIDFLVKIKAVRDVPLIYETLLYGIFDEKKRKLEFTQIYIDEWAFNEMRKEEDDDQTDESTDRV